MKRGEVYWYDRLNNKRIKIPSHCRSIVQNEKGKKNILLPPGNMRDTNKEVRAGGCGFNDSHIIFSISSDGGCFYYYFDEKIYPFPVEYESESTCREKMIKENFFWSSFEEWCSDDLISDKL